VTDFPFDALVRPEPEAAEAWHRWRGALDIDALPYESQQLLPTLAGRLPRWLERDPCAARLQGIVKMVWSRNQVRLRRAAELRQLLFQEAMAPSVIVGPLAWSMVTRDEGAIRFIPYLSLLVAREHLLKSASTLAGVGWELDGELPRGEALDWSSHISFGKGDDVLHLHWRLFPTPAGEAIACERVFLERTRTVSGNSHEFAVMSAEADLLQRLANRPHWDPLPWQADVLMMPFDQVNWDEFLSLAYGFAPAFEFDHLVGRLAELRRDWQLPIPEIAPARRHQASHQGQGAFVRLIRNLSARGRLLWKS